MTYYSMKDYTLKGFRRSKTKNKKYDAIIENKATRRKVHIPFGQIGYSQYKDTTPLKLYKHKNHLDKERRKRYHARHKGFIKDGYYSAGFFALTRLW